MDGLGIALMVLALLTGWLPGPGGFPLFIAGLSLLAINHDWAKRYIDILKKHANNLGEYIFVAKPKVQLAYDIFAPMMITIGILFLINHKALWMVSAGIFLLFGGVTLLLGNRKRYKRIISLFKR